MTSKPTLVVSLIGALGLALAAGTPADAQRAGKPKPAKPACGISVIPLVAGTTWTYEHVAYPTEIPEHQTRLLPLQPKKIVITVDSVETEGKTTTIKLTEDVDGRKLATTATCTATSLSFSPDSFFFMGEPGGTWNVEWDAVERKGQTFPIAKGTLASYEWNDDLSAKWKRIATAGTQADLGAGTLTLERRLVVTADEPVATAAGSWTKAAKLGIQTRGQIGIDGVDAKPYELPEGIVTWFWQVDGVGIVQVHNSFFHAYQLTKIETAAPADGK